MPQPGEVGAVADELIGLWRESHTRLLGELADAVADDRLWRRRARLRDLLAVHAEVIDELTVGTRLWLGSRLPVVHALGAAVAVRAGGRHVWSQPHIEAITHLARRTWTDVAQHLTDIDADGRRVLRGLARASARNMLLEGVPAGSAGRELERAAAREGLWSVRYANGARHGIGDYADTLARTVSAEAYNDGTFTQAEADGFGWMEVFDGPDCGWTSHQDPDKANGTIRRLEDCQAHSLSHPRCARSFAPAPHVTSETEAAAGRRYTPEEQARMAAEEAERARTAPVTLSGRTRPSRNRTRARQG